MINGKYDHIEVTLITAAVALGAIAREIAVLSLSLSLSLSLGLSVSWSFRIERDFVARKMRVEKVLLIFGAECLIMRALPFAFICDARVKRRIRRFTKKVSTSLSKLGKGFRLSEANENQAD